MKWLLSSLVLSFSLLFANCSIGSPDTVYAPASPTLKVSSFFPVVNTYSGNADMFVFSTNAAVSLTGNNAACATATGSTASWFAIPKANPIVGGVGDNPSYRDHINTIMMAKAMDKGIMVWIDLCVAGYPRVVGIMTAP